MSCNYPMHDLYQGGLMCPSCQCRLARIERNMQAVKPTFYMILFTAAVALITKLNRCLHVSK